MSLRLATARHVFPGWARNWMLDELARVTAEGFTLPSPVWTERSFSGRLAQYASFTATQAEALLRSGDTDAIQATRERLRRGAEGLGKRVRRLLGVRTAEDAFETLALLYHQIEIEVAGGPLGEVRVERCFFAGIYTEPVCGLIAALDHGVVSGLYGGASLRFSERLTGGAPCCRAVLELVETGS